MKKVILFLFLLLISVFSFSAEKEKLVIGIVYDGITNENNLISDLIEKEVNSLLDSKYDIVFPKNKQLYDSFNKKDISKKMDQLLNDDDVDIVIAGGILSSYLALGKQNLSKPLFAPFIINNAAVNVSELNGSNKTNLNYIATNLDVKNEIKDYRKIKDFKKLTILMGKEVFDIIPQLDNFFKIYLSANKIDLNYEFVKVSSENLKEVYSKIKDSEAVSVGPMKQLTIEQRKNLIDFINENKIPSFSSLGLGNFKFGLLAGHSYEKELKKRIRGMAVNLSLYLDGKKMKNLPVYLQGAKTEMIVNMETVEKTGIWPSWDVLSHSKLVNFVSEKNTPMAMGLKEVLETAIENNPQIKALEEELKTTDLNIKKAKSNYKPDLEANATAAMIDSDRAESVLAPAEQTLSAGVSLTQVIFSEDANMNIAVQKENKKLKEEELRKEKLDLILETGEAYFTVLKAEAYARIQKTNLELTKSNLEIAKSRKAIGISGPADIYRWESKLANSVSSLIEAMLNVKIAKTNLKRIMNYTLTDEIDIKNTGLDSLDFMTSDKEILEYISNQNKVNALIKYMTDYSLKNAPELKYIDSGINIQERLVKNAKNKRFMPTVALQAKYTRNNIIKEGEGSDDYDYATSLIQLASTGTTGKASESAISNVLKSFGNPDDNEWSIGIGFSLPLYTGGELKADREIAEKEVKTLEYKKEGAKKALEQRVISYTFQIVSEYSKIKNAEISANSANKALKLVKDAYSRGVASITDLIDAQTAAISAEQYKSTVTYDLMTAIMRAERSVGSYYILADSKKRNKMLEELKKINENM